MGPGVKTAKERPSADASIADAKTEKRESPQVGAFRPAPPHSNLKGAQSTRLYEKDETLFSQGDLANEVFFILRGQVKLSVVSGEGKEATIAVLYAGEFVGEDCLAITHPLRLVTATTMGECELSRIDKKQVLRELIQNTLFTETFVTFLLARNARSQEDLIDQLFNSSERRLARILLQLARFGKDGHAEVVIPKISQESLAEMVGTTRSRVSFFMNRFRKQGFIQYDGAIRVHSTLSTKFLHAPSSMNERFTLSICGKCGKSLAASPKLNNLLWAEKAHACAAA
ncbi:MAG: transcriptional regulator, Crp/Fnr family [Acidobacteriales bacterium]|nr:transcriptional regulator, Crp/Fnr family [Terriglobales bacterium]